MEMSKDGGYPVCLLMFFLSSKRSAFCLSLLEGIS